MNTRTDHARVKDPRVDRARSPRTQLSSSYVRNRYVQHVPISSIPLALRRSLTSMAGRDDGDVSQAVMDDGLYGWF